MTRRNIPPIMAAAVIQRMREGQHEVLIGKLPNAPYEGKWTFPSGLVERGEAPEAGLRRALKTLLDASAPVEFGQPPFDHRWEAEVVRWRFFFCDGSSVRINNKYYSEVRWVIPATLREYDFDPVSQQVVDWMLDRDQGSGIKGQGE